MPTTYLPSTNLSINAFYNYYDAPGTNKSVGNVLKSSPGITYPNRGTSNVNMGYYATNSYMFYLKAVNTNGNNGSVYITYPWSQSATSTNSYVGASRQALVTAYPYITLYVTTNYGVFFDGWRTGPIGDPSATIISYDRTINVYYNSSYANYIWYAWL